MPKLRTYCCKMRLMSLTCMHDSYGDICTYICRSLFGLSTFFVASLVFMKDGQFKLCYRIVINYGYRGNVTCK